MHRIPLISEVSMQSAEAAIPQLATQAGRAAHLRALTQTGRVVMRSASGQLVERQAGGEVVVIKALPASTPSRAGLVLKRSKASAKTAAGR